MNYRELLEYIGDDLVPVNVVGYLERVENTKHMGFIHARLIQFRDTGKWEVFDTPVLIIVMSQKLGNEASITATGSLFRGTADIMLGDYKETPDGISYFADITYLEEKDIKELARKYNLYDMLNSPDAYFGNTITTTLKQKEFARSLDDLVWGGASHLSLGVEIAKTAQRSFRNYLNNYALSLSRNKYDITTILQMFSNYLDSASQNNKKAYLDKIQRVIEGISPFSVKSLKGILPRRRLSSLLVKEYGTGVFSYLARQRNPYTLAEDIVTQFTDADWGEHRDKITSAIRDVEYIPLKMEEVDDETTWYETFATACVELMRKEVLLLSIFVFVTDRINLSDIDEVSLALSRMNFNVSPLAVIENNPYILHYFNPNVSLDVMDFFAGAVGLLGTGYGMKTTIIMNMRRALAMVDYFQGLARDSGSTVYEVDSNFATKHADFPNKSIFDVTISVSRGRKLLSDANCFAFLNDCEIGDIKQYFSNPPVTDMLLKSERDALNYIFGDKFKPCKIRWSGRGILQFSTAKTDYRQVSIISTSESARLQLLDVSTTSGDLCGIYVSDKYLFGTTRNFENECIIFDAINALKSNDLNITQEIIEEAIVEFEEMKGFTLEERQKDAVRLASRPILAITGPAGSGKTTTAEAVLYAVQKARGSECNILFAAPTGMAANRLRQVVNRPVVTIHSLLKIGSEDSTPQPVICDVLVIDECSMINSALMSAVMKAIDWDTTQLILIGDKEQLPPIGAGKPFADMLEKQYFDCVALNVVKRCADGSAVTRNATIMLGKEQGRVSTDTANKQFIVIDKPHGRLDNKYDWEQSYIIDLVRWHLGQEVENITTDADGNTMYRGYLISPKKFKPEDISIVTPQRRRHQLGSDALNTLLQPVFNPADSTKKEVYYGLGDNVQTFRVGDRVMNNKNTYSKARYIWKVNEETNKGYYTEYGELGGIMNGEIGYIKDIVHVSEIPYVKNDKINTDVAKRLVDDLDSGHEYALMVEFNDMDLEGNPYNFCIFYMIDPKQKDSPYIHMTDVMGELNLLEHSWALSTHKMQGSQGQLIIVPVFHMHPGLTSKNMVYTAVTRSKDTCYLIGSIYRGASEREKTPFELMLEVQAVDKRNSLLGELMTNRV